MFIFKAVLPPKSAKFREILRKFELIVVQGHPRSSILVPIKAHIRNFLLLINSNIGVCSTVFEILTHFARK